MKLLCSIERNVKLLLITKLMRLQGFREGRYKCLIATDVAARGLDIPEVDLVIQCCPPKVWLLLLMIACDSCSVCRNLQIFLMFANINYLVISNVTS